MRALVTGGAGFVGSHVVDRLVEDGHDVLVIDRLEQAAAGSVNSHARFERIDVRDGDALAVIVRDVDAVFHHAAMVGLESTFSDAVDYVGHNALGTAVLLHALYETGFQGTLVLASSMVVYGEGSFSCAKHGAVRPPPRRVKDLDAGQFDPVCSVCDGPLVARAMDEAAPLEPRNVYAATKVHQEHLCFAFARATGAAVVALRYHNIYGPRMPRNTPYAGVASIFRSELLDGRPPDVFEDGRQLRDFVHVSDVARANALCLAANGPVSGAFNIASGEPHSIGEMAALMSEPFGIVPVVSGRYRLGDVRHVFASPRRAKEVLGFVAGVRFDVGMKELVEASD